MDEWRFRNEHGSSGRPLGDSGNRLLVVIQHYGQCSGEHCHPLFLSRLPSLAGSLDNPSRRRLQRTNAPRNANRHGTPTSWIGDCGWTYPNARRALALASGEGNSWKYPWGKRFVQVSCCRWKKSDLAFDACGGCGNCSLGKIAKFVVGRRKTNGRILVRRLLEKLRLLCVKLNMPTKYIIVGNRGHEEQISRTPF